MSTHSHHLNPLSLEWNCNMHKIVFVMYFVSGFGCAFALLYSFAWHFWKIHFSNVYYVLILNATKCISCKTVLDYELEWWCSILNSFQSSGMFASLCIATPRTHTQTHQNAYFFFTWNALDICKTTVVANNWWNSQNTHC